jgi:glutaryl-CoA dehydrogenase
MPTAQRPLELLGADSLLSEEERAVRDTVRAFADDRIRPHVARWFADGRLPARELALEMGRLGLMGMHLSGYGCAGASAVAYGLACMELEAADSGIRSMVSVQGSLAMYAISRYGSEEQKQAWLPGMASGELIGCFGLTEPDAGSDPGAMRSRASRAGADWVLDGTKMWITNGGVADVAVVWARTEEGVRGFLVPRGTPGFTVTEVDGKLSLRASVTSELVLSQVRLPGDAMLPGAKGLSGPLNCLNEARFGIVFGAVGAARDCLSTALDYAAHREVFGRPLAHYQLSQGKFADMTVSLSTAMLLAMHLGRLKDRAGLTPAQVSLGKLNNVRTALQIARECRTLLGASGVTLDYPVLRHANNLEAVLTYEGTNEVHQLVVGEAVTGLAAFRLPRLLSIQPGSELADGGDDLLGHQVQRAERAGVDDGAVRDLEAEFGQFVQVLDGLLDVLAVLAEVKTHLRGLLDAVVVAAFSGAVLAQHVELVCHLGGVEDIARVRVAGHQPQRLLFPGAADENGRVRPGRRLRGIQGAFQLVVLPVERAVILAPHLQADAQRLIEPFEPFGKRREEQAEPVCFGLVPGRPDAQHRPAARQHVQRGDLLGQQPRLPVDHRRHDREQLDPGGPRGQPAQRGVGLEHLVFWRPDVPDLPHMVHHANPVHATLLGRRGHLTQPPRQSRRTAVPREIRDMQADLHPSTLLNPNNPTCVRPAQAPGNRR